MSRATIFHFRFFQPRRYTARACPGLFQVRVTAERRATRRQPLFKRYRRSGVKTIRELIAEQSRRRKTDFSLRGWMLNTHRRSPSSSSRCSTPSCSGGALPLFHRSAYPFLNTGLRQNNEYTFHALAIDEHRRAFAPTLWTNQGATGAAPRPIERTEQRWFVGAHANVGGGCFQRSLGATSLQWLERQSRARGLAFKDDFAPTECGQRADLRFLRGFHLGLVSAVQIRAAILPASWTAPEAEGPGVTTINERRCFRVSPAGAPTRPIAPHN